MKVVIVEDQTLFKDFLVKLIKDMPECELVGEAIDGDEAISVVREKRPDLVILDILIPKRSGIIVARTLKEEMPTLRILALSMEMDLKTLHQVNQLRLSGFVDKNDATIETLTTAIRLIGQRKRYFSESMKASVMRLKADSQSFQKLLTPREQEVLSYIGAGLSDADIAEKLGLSATSVHTHRSNLMHKLNIHSTPGLMRFASEMGFWKPVFKSMDLEESYHLHD